ncbi:IclR family transcriptional regulator [Aureimonas sp. SK2]|uniref:IclR family transcriptional regulator n=1 Tax=Aureimonas sp. SK2 TaxID=3015992 RepID=UPI0024448ACD|nr:IclR family transcriptional regulator [Aureimonas sp. SK2]
MDPSAGQGGEGERTLVPASGAQAVDRALALLSLVGREAERGIALSEIVEASGLNKPTARRLLVALMRSRLVEQSETTRRYYLSDEVYVLGVLASSRYSLLDVAMESLRTLAQASGDTSFLSMRRDAHAVCLHREEGAYPVRSHVLQARDQHPLGVGAGSLALLSSLPDAEIAEILQRNAPILAERYPGCSPDELREGVRRTRQDGYAFNPGLVVASSWGIGQAVMFPDGRVAGALSIAAIDSRLQPDRRAELASLLRAETAKVEAKLARLFSRERARPASFPRREPAAVSSARESHHV